MDTDAETKTKKVPIDAPLPRFFLGGVSYLKGPVPKQTGEDGSYLGAPWGRARAKPPICKGVTKTSIIFTSIMTFLSITTI